MYVIRTHFKCANLWPQGLPSPLLLSITRPPLPLSECCEGSSPRGFWVVLLYKRKPEMLVCEVTHILAGECPLHVFPECGFSVYEKTWFSFWVCGLLSHSSVSQKAWDLLWGHDLQVWKWDPQVSCVLCGADLRMACTRRLSLKGSWGSKSTCRHLFLVPVCLIQ